MQTSNPTFATLALHCLAPIATAQPPALVSRHIPTPLGPMIALADEQGLRLLDFTDRRHIDRHTHTVQHALQRSAKPSNHPLLDLLERELSRYFAAQPSVFTASDPSADPLATVGGIPLAPISPSGTIGGTPFQRAAWSELRRIPAGQTRTYAQQARAIGNPKAVRAVARANAENFLSLIIPCHRVIGADGSMTGYGGGVDRKRWLLTHEAKFAAPTPPPDDELVFTPPGGRVSNPTT